MRHTFNEFEKHFKPDTIQLLFGEHMVNIDTRVTGSAAIMRAFLTFKFDFESYNEEHKHLILKY